MKQTKHEYAIEKIRELTEKYNLPKLDCLDCFYANFGKLNLWLFHEFNKPNKENPRICYQWAFKTKNSMKYVETRCYCSDNTIGCNKKISLFDKTQLELQSIKDFSQEMNDFLKKAPKIRIPNNPLKLGVLL